MIVKLWETFENFEIFNLHVIIKVEIIWYLDQISTQQNG